MCSYITFPSVVLPLLRACVRTIHTYIDIKLEHITREKGKGSRGEKKAIAKRKFSKRLFSPSLNLILMNS